MLHLTPITSAALTGKFLGSASDLIVAQQSASNMPLSSRAASIAKGNETFYEIRFVEVSIQK